MHNIVKKTVLIAAGFISSFIILEFLLWLGGGVYKKHQEYQNAKIVKRAFTEKRILCLGESTTAGAYPKELAALLKSRGYNFAVIDKGLPASNTGSIVSQLKSNIAKYKPHIVITMMGINDNETSYYYNLKSNAAFIRNLKILKLLKLIKRHYAANIMSFQVNQCINVENSQDYNKIAEKALFRKAKKYQMRDQHEKAARMCEIYADLYGYDMDVCNIIAEEYRCAYQKSRIQEHLDKAMFYYRAVLKIDPDNERAKHGIEISRQMSRNRLSNKNEVGYSGVLPSTVVNYKKFAEIIGTTDIKWLCMQYPKRKIENFKVMLAEYPDILFVENYSNFIEAEKQFGYDKYFIDRFAEDFGHCSLAGNKLIAENIVRLLDKKGLL